MLEITSRIRIPDDELIFTFSRSSGPGGQNVNKVNSKALLRFNAVASQSLPEDVRQRLLTKIRGRLTNEGELLISSQRFRDQAKNQADCLEKLRALILSATLIPKARRKTKPSKGSIERRLDAKKMRSEKKRRRSRVEE